MSDQAVPRVDVSIGDVHHSQLVIGDHNTIQTPEGTEVTVLQVGERPVPKLRPMPLARRAGTVEIVGREKELTLIASAAAGMPVQLYAPDGAGKTSLLKCAAGQTPAPAEGVAFEPARHRSLDEVQNSLYAAFWACDVPFIPDPAQIGGYLADREALVLLDDCDLDRSETETLLDRIPRCTLVLASKTRTLWSQGTALGLADLDPAAAVQLLERALGQPLDSGEREAAENLVASLGGNPQSLVETAALIADGGSLRELAEDPDALRRRSDPSALTDSQKRILEILSALDGAALGVEHIASLAGLPDAQPPLRELEQRGWVKSASPRYRSVRRLPPEASLPEGEILRPLLARLTAWSEEAAARAVADEAEAIERTLELGAAAERWRETTALALAAQRGLLVAGAWSVCQRVLRIGLRAAGEIEDASARAFSLHQLGSQSLVLGDRGEAAARLTEALRIREELGEKRGAELTRHNLSQLGGGGDGGGDEGGGGGGPPRLAIALAVLAVVAGIVAAIALTGGDSAKTSNAGASTPSPRPTTTTTTEPSTPTEPTTKPTTPTPPPPGAPPTITIASPRDGASFDEEATAKAEFGCAPAEGAQLESCDATIDGTPVEAGDLLPMSAGDHAFRVTALDDDGGREAQEVTYNVAAPPPPPPPADELAPEITIASPAEGQYLQGELIHAEYSCVDNVDKSVPCNGPIEKGGAVETKSLGGHTFTVTSVDSAGNEASETVQYEVIESKGKG